MKSYVVSIIYTRATGPSVEHEAVVEVQANSKHLAAEQADRWFKGDFRRRTSTVKRINVESAVIESEPEITSTVIEQDPTPVVGQRYTLRNFHHKVIVRAVFEDTRNRKLVVIESLSQGKLATIGEREFIDLCRPKRRTEFWSIYPQKQGEDAPRLYKSGSPVRNSSYDLDDLVQLKVVFEGDKIVSKEIIEP